MTTCQHLREPINPQVRSVVCGYRSELVQLYKCEKHGKVSLDKPATLGQKWCSTCPDYSPKIPEN